MRKASPLAFAFVVCFGAVIACVGTDPDVDTTNPPDDAGERGADVASSGNDSSSVSEAAPPLPPLPCRLDLPFEAAKPFAPMNTDADENALRFSADETFAYLSRGDTASYNIFVGSNVDAFATATLVPNINIVEHTRDVEPTLAPNSLEVIFASNRPFPTPDLPIDDQGAGVRFWRATRTNAVLDFEAPLPLKAPLNRRGGEPYLTPDGSALYYRDTSSGKNTIRRSARVDGGTFAPSTEVVPDDAKAPVIAVDETLLYFSRLSDKRIWAQTRFDKDSLWAAPAPVGELSSYEGHPTWLSANGCRLYFVVSNNTAPLSNIWVVEKPKS